MGELLQALFTGKPDKDCILIWRLETKRSQWFSKIDLVKPSASKGNTYFGVGTVSGPDAAAAGNFKRSTNATVSGIGALWLDVDIAGPAHKKGNLPATAESALALVEVAFPGLPPSCVVDSGHGLQLYWLFKQWHQVSDDNRAETSSLLLDFNTHWRNVCKAHGFDADSVCDLARVMRLPGTMNNKVPGDPRPVTQLVMNQSLRYPFADIRQWLDTKGKELCPAHSPRPKPNTSTSKGAAVKSATPTTPTLDADKIEALLESDTRIKQSWNHDRKDLTDQSPSSYDMSLMAFAVRAEWSDAEVVALVKACRKHHNQEIKDHAIIFTLRKVKAEQAALREKEQVAADAEAAEPTADKLKKLSEGLGFEITSITRFDSTPPAFVLTLGDGQRVPLGIIDGLTDQKKFRNTIAATVGILPNRSKPDQWDHAVRLLLSCLDHDSAGTEATEDGQAVEWIKAYLNSTTIHHGGADLDNRETGLLAGQPWSESGCVHITGTVFRSWLVINLGDRIDSRRLGLMLRSIGSEPCTVATRGDGESRTTRAAWKISRQVWATK